MFYTSPDDDPFVAKHVTYCVDGSFYTQKAVFEYVFVSPHYEV